MRGPGRITFAVMTLAFGSGAGSELRQSLGVPRVRIVGAPPAGRMQKLEAAP